LNKEFDARKGYFDSWLEFRRLTFVHFLLDFLKLARRVVAFRRRNLAEMLFVKLVVQLVHLDSGPVQRSLAGWRYLVNPSLSSTNNRSNGLQEAIAFQPVQERVEGSWTDAVPVMLEFFHHGQTKDRLMKRMHEDVDAYEAEEEFTLMFQHTLNIPPV
jgi:hypothetical protein